MEALIKAILGCMPGYLNNLGTLLIRPERFIAERNANTDANFNNALGFLVISICLSVILEWSIVPPGTDLWVHLSARTIRVMSVTFSYGAALRIAWWLVGGKAPFRALFISYCYPVSMALVVTSAAQVLARGVFKTYDPQNYEVFYYAFSRGRPLPDLEDNSAFLVHMWIIFGSFFLASIWSLWTWEPLRELNHASKGRSGIALLLMWIFAYPLAALGFFVSQALNYG